MSEVIAADTSLLVVVVQLMKNAKVRPCVGLTLQHF